LALRQLKYTKFNRPTDRHTDHATPSVATGRIVFTECMRRGLKIRKNIKAAKTFYDFWSRARITKNR